MPMQGKRHRMSPKPSSISTQRLQHSSAAKPVFVGSSEYMLTSIRLLGELVIELENDLQELRAVHSAVVRL